MNILRPLPGLCVPPRRRAPASALLALLFCLPAWGQTAAPYPGRDWPAARDLSAAGTSRDRVKDYESWLAQHGGEYWAGVVIRNGYAISTARGPRGHIHQKNDCGSIKKSLQGTVLGAALHQKKLKSLDENALHYWKEPFETPFENDREISFRQFARYQDRWNEEPPPGTFHYNNSGAVAAGACIAGLFGEVRGPMPRGIAEAARREVMAKIGADWDLWYWETPFQAGRSGNPGPRMVMDSSVHELAKLGYLWLRRGVWRNTRIFSEDFYREAVTDWSPDTGDSRFGYVGHYGYWWFVNSGQALLPGVPEDAFYHIGNGSPKRATALLIIPSLDIVAVLSMERISDDGKWDVIRNSRSPSNDGMRPWAAEVVKLAK